MAGKERPGATRRERKKKILLIRRKILLEKFAFLVIQKVTAGVR